MRGQILKKYKASLAFFFFISCISYKNLFPLESTLTSIQAIWKEHWKAYVCVINNRLTKTYKRLNFLMLIIISFLWPPNSLYTRVLIDTSQFCIWVNLIYRSTLDSRSRIINQWNWFLKPRAVFYFSRYVWIPALQIYYSKTLLHSLERAAAGIGLHVNAHKTEYMCFNQTGDISALNGSSLKLVDKFTYQGSSVSSTETDIDTWQTKVWTAINSLSVI